MGDFRNWFGKMLLNLDEGNLREALYCSDMALYSAERNVDEPDQEDLAKVYLVRGKTLDRLGRGDEAKYCFRIVEELKAC
jgi:hypothetical protein